MILKTAALFLFVFTSTNIVFSKNNNLCIGLNVNRNITTLFGNIPAANFTAVNNITIGLTLDYYRKINNKYAIVAGLTINRKIAKVKYKINDNKIPLNEKVFFYDKFNPLLFKVGLQRSFTVLKQNFFVEASPYVVYNLYTEIGTRDTYVIGALTDTLFYTKNFVSEFVQPTTNLGVEVALGFCLPKYHKLRFKIFTNLSNGRVKAANNTFQFDVKYGTYAVKHFADYYYAINSFGLNVSHSIFNK